MLQNKDGLWKSYDLWKFSSNADLIYIQNINKSKVLSTTNDNKVILYNFEQGNAVQVWKKGEPNAEGYFTLENYKAKFLTAASTNNLEVVTKGNKTLRWIPPTS